MTLVNDDNRHVSGPAAGTRRATRAFRATPGSVGAARRFVEKLGRGHPDSPVAALLTSELATNAVVHARTPFEVTASVTDLGVRVEVSDGSDVVPDPAMLPGPFDERGRGLVLVAALAAAWGCEPTAGGKVVWFETGRRASVPGPAGRASWR